MTIGIIEDDRLLSRSLKVVLEKEGYRTLQVYTKKDAGQILQGTEELLLVDIGLPDGNGMELYHTLMKKWNRKIPAIFLTARDEEQEMLKAFDLGAEDYVVKPFSMKVLLKRIEVAFRRNRGEDAGEQILKCRDLTLYPQRKKAVSGEKEISLTAKEYQLLEYLMNKHGYDIKEMLNILNKKSGVLGISGVSSDFRDLEDAAPKGNQRAQLALDSFEYGVIKLIGSYAAAMGGVDAIIFTAGVGENGAENRVNITKKLAFMGVKLDEEKNKVRGQEIDVSAADAKVRVLVIPTNEELMIAMDTAAIVKG
jgi:DNA-binding response OmpR family regulator